MLKPVSKKLSLVAAASSLAMTTNPVVIVAASWIITAFMAVNTLGNLASLSVKEKVVFGPITSLLTLACLLISASSPAI